MHLLVFFVYLMIGIVVSRDEEYKDVIQKDYKGEVCLSLSFQNSPVHNQWKCMTVNGPQYTSSRPGYSFQNVKCLTECQRFRLGEDKSYICKVKQGEFHYCSQFSFEPIYTTQTGIRCLRKPQPPDFNKCSIYKSKALRNLGSPWSQGWDLASKDPGKTVTGNKCVDTCERQSSNYQCNTTKENAFYKQYQCSSEFGKTVDGEMCAFRFETGSNTYCYTDIYQQNKGTISSGQGLVTDDGKKCVSIFCCWRSKWWCYKDNDGYWNYASPKEGLDVYRKLCENKCENNYCRAINYKDPEGCSPVLTVLISKSEKGYLCLDECDGTCTTYVGRIECDPNKTLQKELYQRCSQPSHQRVGRAFDSNFDEKHNVYYRNAQERDRVVKELEKNKKEYVNRFVEENLPRRFLSSRTRNSFIMLADEEETRRFREMTDNIDRTGGTMEGRHGPVYESPEQFVVVTLGQNMQTRDWRFCYVDRSQHPRLGINNRRRRPGEVAMVNHYEPPINRRNQLRNQRGNRDDPCNRDDEPRNNNEPTYSPEICDRLGTVLIIDVGSSTSFTRPSLPQHTNRDEFKRR